MASGTREKASERSALEQEIHHRDGCPEERAEMYQAARPNGEVLTVARCIDCGAATVE